MKKSNAFSRLYKYYLYDIFPAVKQFRGATRLKDFLQKLAHIEVEKISEKEAEPISGKEWNNLIILDGARADTYRESINDEADVRISCESHSKGFIRENFSDGDWSDTVVITANPFYNEKYFEELTGEKPEEIFEAVFQVWETDWNNEKGTVLPKTILERTRTAEKLFPKSRKIIHMMQPHYPFINSTIEEPGYRDAVLNESYEHVWERAEKNDIEHETVAKAYLQNHEVIIPVLDEFKNLLSGRTMVTSDHGNLLGENGLYGHPGDSNLKPLRQVPWDELD